MSQQHYSRLCRMVMLTYTLCYSEKIQIWKNQKGDKDATSLFQVTKVDPADVCTVLLKNNVNINEKVETGATSLVVHEDHANISTVLLESNANTSENMKNNATTLFQAAHQGHADIYLVLLENNPNIKEV